MYFKIFKNLHTSKIFSTTSTISYSKILDKYLKNSLAKWGLIFRNVNWSGNLVSSNLPHLIQELTDYIFYK